jgi:dihydropteroate synthase
MKWQIRGRQVDLSQQGLIMGILNVTPDSFSDGGNYHVLTAALQHAQTMLDEGAGIIDIGGESTRPGAQPVSTQDELARVLPVIEQLRARTDAFISIDTMKPVVAAAALDLGADIINDVTGFRDPLMRKLAARTQAGCVVMHMQGEPRTMQAQPQYNDVVTEVQARFRLALAELTAAGVTPEQIVFDPGIGFGKRLEHNRALLQALDRLSIADRPLLLGVSRKSFLSAILNDSSVAARSWPTIAITSYARTKGVRLHRVHEVRPNLHALRMTEAILHQP